MKLQNTKNVNIWQFAVNFLRIYEAYIDLSVFLCSAFVMNFTMGKNTNNFFSEIIMRIECIIKLIHIFIKLLSSVTIIDNITIFYSIESFVIYLLSGYIQENVFRLGTSIATISRILLRTICLTPPFLDISLGISFHITLHFTWNQKNCELSDFKPATSSLSFSSCIEM